MLAVLAAAAAVVVAAAALLSSPRDVAVLEIGGGGGVGEGRVELVPVDGGAAGPESLAFDGGGGGPYAGVSDGRVLRWVPGERRWEEHSSSCAPELYVRPPCNINPVLLFLAICCAPSWPRLRSLSSNIAASGFIRIDGTYCT